MMSAHKPTALLVFGIDPKRIGGIELQTRAAVEKLARCGWQCVLAFHSVPREPVLGYLSLEGVIWEQLPNAWGASRATVSGLKRLLRKYRPDLLHLQFTPMLSVFPMLAHLHGVRKIFVTDHGSRPEGYVSHPAPLLKRIAGRMLNTPLTRAIAVSEYNRRTLIEYGYVGAEKAVRIYNGTDMTLDRHQGEGARFRERYGIPEGRTIMTQVCWMITAKGVGDLIEAARIALASDPALHFVLVGEGEQQPEFIEQARGAGIEGHFTWTGLVRDPHAEGVYAATDILCQLSRWEESFGMVITEAMVYGKPVVATRVGGIPELVRDGETGRLLERGDIRGMAEAILQLARDASLRRRLGQSGRALAETEFDVRKTSSQLMQVYGLVESAGPG